MLWLRGELNIIKITGTKTSDWCVKLENKLERPYDVYADTKRSLFEKWWSMSFT